MKFPKLWPKNLAGQFIWLLLAALILSQIITTLIFLHDRENAVMGLNRRGVVNQIYATIRLLQDSPVSLQKRILRSASSENIRFWIKPLPEADDIHYEEMDTPFSAALNDLGITKIVVLGQSAPRPLLQKTDRQGPPDFKNKHRPPFDELPPDWNHLAVQLNDGRWLHIANRFFAERPFFFTGNILSILITAVILILIVIFMVRRITKPLKRLTIAADKLGRGENVEPVLESGPSDLKKTIESFNLMNERLQRFVKDRTSLLAAVSHDLRTPITSMKLRAELMDEGPTQDAFLATLDEMQAIAEATLSFVRDDANTEETQEVDITALLDSMCEDYRAQGKNVSLTSTKTVVYTCRLVSLKRAITNLIENALKYGKEANIRVITTKDKLTIYVDDEGPGIPEEQMEDMFKPFTRLEKSRNQSTGGVGLGLSIARSIARNHGGDIQLKNRKFGMSAMLILPIHH